MLQNAQRAVENDDEATIEGECFVDAYSRLEARRSLNYLQDLEDVPKPPIIFTFRYASVSAADNAYNTVFDVYELETGVKR